MADSVPQTRQLNFRGCMRSTLAGTVVQAGSKLGCRAGLGIVIVIFNPLLPLLTLSEHLLMPVLTGDAVLNHPSLPSDPHL
eukprot:CAMPEP_0174936806 /NCGR_PEP_ID=MMETSP1355-20121228/58673_1 /TAXON_ID=464990 /ORGANISM="Hemiselmis tepida, Strain CCMP443" /LENGTH=80 /DNA_ID=CAMNT_0016183623 /DNA_START=210 /DNA_END=448 /DNA_ORIENTATION=-